jgi:glycosyltransferase involved in cell wall biosynthesis
MTPPTLVVAAAGGLGGAERVLLDWAGALEPSVVLACPPGPLAAAAADAGLAIAPLAARSLRRRGRSGRAALDLMALARDIARLTRAHRPAVVVASGERSLLAAAWAPRHGARLLALHHDAPRGGALGAVLGRAAARSDAIVATSAAIAPRGATVIHPGVDLSAWALPDPPAGAPRALCLGALVPWKRADLALEIAALVPGLQLDLAGAPLPGDPPEFAAALHRRATQPDLAGRVRFLGALDDPRPALASAHLLLHCADLEPFGLVLVEALAADRPVVAPAAGGPVEIVTPGNGRLYAPGDAAAGAAAVQAVLADPGLRGGARTRARAFDGPAAAARFAATVAALGAR